MAELVQVSRKEWLELKRLVRQAAQQQIQWLTEEQVSERGICTSLSRS